MLNSNFIELLQLSLGTREGLSHAFDKKEWDEVYQAVQRMSMTGICFQGLQRLGGNSEDGFDAIGMAEMTYLTWMAKRAVIQQKNKLANARCKEITEMLAKDGYRACILKGQANALYYPHPELRMAGDIDVWVVPNELHGLEADRKTIANYVIAHEEDYVRMQYHHIDYHVFPDVEVEVHFCPMILFSHRKNKKLQEKFIEEMDFCFRNFNHDRSFCTLTFMPNVLMQLVHMYRHVFDGGIGLKQFVDFYYLLCEIYRHEGRAGYHQLRKHVQDIGLSDFCGGVCYVIEQLFLNGKNQDILLISPNEKHGKLLLQEIERYGAKPDTAKDGKPASKLSNFTGSIARNSRLWTYYPTDCLWNILYRLSQYLWRKRNGWK